MRGGVTTVQRWLAILIVAAILPVLWLEPLTAAASGEDAEARLQSFLDETRSLDAAFRQEVQAADWGADELRVGRFLAEKPGRFRWDYEEPFVQNIISNGETVWYYEPDLKQATRAPWSRLEKTPAAFLSAGGRMRDSFQVMVVSNKRLGLPAVKLIPKSAEGAIVEIVVTLHPERPEIAELEMVDNLNNRSFFTFQEMRRNGDIAADRFRFTPPAGVDVVDHQ